MNYDKLKKVLVALGVVESAPTEMAVTAVLADGTTIGADAFEIGNPLYTIATDGTQTPATAGTYETADSTITVDENGLISDIVPLATPETEVTAAAEEVAAPEEKPADEASENDAIAKIVSALEALIKELSTMKTSMSSLESKVNKFSKAPGAEKIKTGNSTLFAFRNAEMTSLEKKMAIVKEMRAGK